MCCFTPEISKVLNLTGIFQHILCHVNDKYLPILEAAVLSLRSVSSPQDGARKTALLEDNNNLLSYCYDDAKTMYEVFQRGLRVSGEVNFPLYRWLACLVCL